MHTVWINTGEWMKGSNTEVRLEFEDDAKLEAEKWSGPGEKMLDKCFWRFVYENRDKIRGDRVTFRLNKQDVLGLIERLRVANAETIQ
jgi:hypothetical protein